MHALLVLAVSSIEEHSKTAFYVAGGLSVVWAVAIGVIGITRPAFPNGEAGARAVLGVGFVLMVASMATAVITA